jgi:hypothetical protein
LRTHLVILTISLTLFGVFHTDTSTVHAQTTCGVDYDFIEQNGLVVIEAESIPATGGWEEQNATGGFTGDGYLIWEGDDSFREPGNGTLSYRIKIDTPGTYRYTHRTRILEGNSNTEANDLWLRFPQAQGFFGEKGNGDRVYPRGNERGNNGSDQTPYPEGDNKNGWFKIYMNTLGSWHWQASTSDFDPHDIYVTFSTPGVYTLQISGRSRGYAVDRMVLFQESTYTENQAENTNLAETGCADNGGGTPLNTVDVDSNGEVTPADAVFVANRLGANLNTGNNGIADVNNDGEIDVTDIELVTSAISTTFD